MDKKRELIGCYNYTVILTYIGMLAGFTGIIYVMDSQYKKAVICLMTAGLCDMFDGSIAATMKRTRREKRFGIQIDSLSDLICFGALPATFTYSICGKTVLSLVCADAYLLCALIRLAYFNVSEEERQETEPGRRKYYVGLPVTTSAAFLPLVFILQNARVYSREQVYAWVLFIMAAAFVTPFRIKKPALTARAGLMAAGVIGFIVVLWRVSVKL